ncbi:sensor histidine kinase [Thermoanaerobacterium sp. RBIITD]|uniref:sensor histidine kinase n=1 Tax=Thermoanaerobacterium sp. RBIITD TaxID=1550240 RepID=UPI000BBFDA98|nr:sensor histidine kinase [Thermoanaerobacterium sp. RBIITD]SNX53961.1 Signal transduction histidine kinase [Thermoanaerobacterium sp. RBIITD]
MDIWFILCKFIIIIYILIKYFINEMAVYPESFVFFILIYICINMAYYIIDNKLIKKAILILSIALSAICYLYINKLFVLLLPINIYELSFNLFSTNLSFIISIFILFLLDSSTVSEYTIIALMSYLICFIAQRLYEKIEKLKSQNDDLREKIQMLYNKINKSEEYEKQVRYTAQLEERNKISQKIHDNVGHTISGSLMQLEASKLLIDKNKDDAKKLIQNAIDTLRNGLESIRLALREIKPPVEQMGINRLRLIINDFTVKTHIPVNLEYTGILDKITYSQWNVIVENVKEALTNIMKYSKATKVVVSIDVLNKFIKTEVKDNGVGAYIIKKGLGLSGIEERCGSIGGKVIIDGSNGFSVIFLLPLEGD